MITYEWATFENFNQSGLSGLFLYPASIIPMFIPLVLFCFFVIIMLSTYFSEKRTTGQADFFASMAAAAYATMILSFVMSLVENLINSITVVICVVIAVISTILLMTSRD